MKRATLEELAALLAAAEDAVPTGGSYRHYRDNKGEHVYTVTGHAVTEDTSEVVVLYQSSEQKVVFSRPLTEFVETVRGGTQKRFQKIIT